MAVLRWAPLAGVLLIGCGDALVTQDYRGVPLFTIEGRVTDIRYEFQVGEQLQASVFWSLAGDTTINPADLVEQTAVAVRVTFPAAFRINLFDEPDPELVNANRLYWLGQIMVYEDEDQNGRFSPGELRGGASYSALLFAAHPLLRDESPTGQALPAGFTVVNLPLPCSVPDVTPPVQGEDCGVPLGSGCTSSGDCGRGVCLTSDGYATFPDGYCSLPEQDGCVPSNSAVGYFYIPPQTPIDQEHTSYYYAACGSDRDCRPGYECFAYANACLPKLPVFIDIFPGFRYSPLCGRPGA